MTGEATPTVDRVLDCAFREAQAVVVLFTGDDLAYLREPLLQESDGKYERVPTPQARPNVLLEAGMALGRHPRRTIISSLGELRPLSDLAGRHLVVLDGEASLRDLRTRLETAGCICTPGRNWLKFAFTKALLDLPTTKTKAVSVAWSHDDAPVAEKVIRDALHSLLLLGTSHYGVVTGNQRRYQTWLAEDQKRQLGILFLHPDSPHATARRPGLHRSNRSDIRVAFERALQLARRHASNLQPLLYEGPYRYSARGVDLGMSEPNPQQRVTVFTSSHQEGISRGFRISLTPDNHADCFAYYEEELLSLWKQAQSNIPGHGISIVARWTNPPSELTLANFATQILSAHARTEFVLFPPEQLHATITSLCRTRFSADRLAGPLEVASRDALSKLPQHFPSFALQVLEAILSSSAGSLNVVLDRASLDDRGFLILSGNDENTALTTVLERINAIRLRLANDFPKEREAWEAGDHAPKDQTWRPHITIGRAFHRDGTHLPVPLCGPPASQRLTSPIAFRVDQLSVVHYAYRSLLRCIGQLTVPMNKPVAISPEQLMRVLRICTTKAE